ncbi:hypothetical protein [Sulfoacidibacillus ferrooxidans]|uniref:Uncharacterized protein n=1 Tax=Sulfoacidibacillus ferrooxidans TaxID=2005001 RepID=A0A9X1VBV9_9BACL|nr:hypothetical protein [Sulfoacidibacillus ferrooxidans]MCI0184460.1 hypothetical protein [Sulfoacidibacillus ferrooxidans]
MNYLLIITEIKKRTLTSESRLLISKGKGYVLDETLHIADCLQHAWEEIVGQKYGNTISNLLYGRIYSHDEIPSHS